MTFVAYISYWCEFTNKEKNVHCFLVAEDFRSAMDYICNYYDENCIEKVTLEVFSPDQMLEFDESNIEEYATFNEIVSQLSPKVIW